MPAKDLAPVVPARNDPTAYEPYAKSQSTLVQDADPAFQYEWFRADQLDVKTRQHEIGSANTGYLKVAGWELCHDKESLTLGRGPASGGKPLDTVIRKGDLYLCKLPKDEYAKYQVIERAKDDLVSKRLVGGEKHRLPQNVSVKTRTVGGRAGVDASTSDVLGGI